MYCVKSWKLLNILKGVVRERYVQEKSSETRKRNALYGVIYWCYGLIEPRAKADSAPQYQSSESMAVAA